MNVLKTFILILLFCIHTSLFSQNEEAPLVSDYIETLIEESEADFDFNTLLETLSAFEESPIDLNTASLEELQQLQILNAQQVWEIKYYRDTYGPFLSFYELKGLQTFDNRLIAFLLPYISLSNVDDKPTSFKNMLKFGKDQVFLRFQRVLQEKEGYKTENLDSLQQANKRYFGNPDKVYVRYKHHYKTNFAFGLTAEKDSGEELFKGAQENGFDYYSAHIYLKDYGKIKYAALGDYQVNIGQGLTMWSGFSFNKGPDVLNIKKAQRLIKPYTSVNENDFLRGGALTYQISDFQLTGFASHKAIDANISLVDTITDELQAVSSFQESGLHRTRNEIEDRKSIDQTVFGGNLSFRKRNLSIGISGVHTSFSAALNRQDRLTNLFVFEGEEITNFGINYSYIWRNLHFFGETATGVDQGLATLNGLLVQLDHSNNLSVLYRNYNRDYQSIFANGFGESSNTNNESGLYLGWTTSPIKDWKLSTYFDAFKNPWLKFRTDAPSNGYEFLSQITYTPNYSTEVYGRIKYESKKINETDNEGPLDVLVDQQKLNLRLHAATKVNYRIRLKSRFEYSTFQSGDSQKEDGYLLYQDITYQLKSTPLSLSTRFAIFNTSSFNTRIYAYERDVLYAFTVPAYFDQGTRFYLLATYKPTYNLSLWLRYAQTNRPNATSIGSGLEEIDGNVSSEIKAQVRFKF